MARKKAGQSIAENINARKQAVSNYGMSKPRATPAAKSPPKSKVSTQQLMREYAANKKYSTAKGRAAVARALGGTNPAHYMTKNEAALRKSAAAIAADKKKRKK